MPMTGSAGRTATVAAVVTALAGSFLAGMAVAGGTTATPPAPGPGVLPGSPIQLVGSELELPGDCEELLASYVERGLERVGPYGWDGPEVVYQRDGLFLEGPAAAEDSAGAGEASVAEQSSSATGTNVQEVGVDEPDVVKTDGTLLARILEEDVALYDVTGSSPAELAEIDLPSEVDGAELLLAGESLVVIGEVGQSTDVGGYGDTRVLTYDVTDPADPTLVDHRGYDSALVRAVQHDDDVRLVLSQRLPDLDFVEPRFWRSHEGALERNQEAVRSATIEDWLPTVTTYDATGAETGSVPLLACEEVIVPTAEAASLGTMAVVGFDVDDPTDADTLGIATDTRLAYVSTDRLYLAASSVSSWWGPWDCCWEGGLSAPDDADYGRSRIHAFELDGTDTRYVASGVVDGVIEDRWSMDEHAGVLRVAVGPSVETGNFSSVLTLREDGPELEEIGRVDKLGIDEDIKAVRWFDDLAIVVTFRQIDPLYAVDLADPEAPRLLGELKIPGFSEYLHPISGQRLIGLGQDADPQTGQVRGAQAALFDVGDLTDPKRTDTVGYRPGSVAGAATDPRQFTWLPDRETGLAVIADGWEGRTGWVSVLRVDGDRMTSELIEVEYGSDVDLVRTVPLPDGRVVLVTGEEVSFLPV